MKMTTHQCYHTKLCNSSAENSEFLSQKNDSLMLDEESLDYFTEWDQVSSFKEADASTTWLHDDESKDETSFDALSSDLLNGKNSKKFSTKHVPHRQKPPQLVAKRNLRERNRVQAVNVAFNRLRKAVPIQHARGKRISKVKTLHNAINYIKGLQELLHNEYFQEISMMGYYSTKQSSVWWDLEYQKL